MVKMTMKNSADVAVEAKPVHGENYWFMVLLYFASFLVGLGIIAMIAANWQQIPNSTKLLGALIAMILNASFLWWTMLAQKNVLKQVVACVYAFLIMAVIGLIGQIFHLQTNICNALLLWGVCSWPLLFAAPRLLWLWLPLFYAGTRFIEVEEGWFDIQWFDSSAPALSGFVFATQSWWIVLARVLAVLGLFTAYEIFMCKGNTENKTIRRPLFLFGGFMMYLLFSNVVRITHTIAYSVNTNPSEALGYAQIFMGTYIVPCLLFALAFYGLNKSCKRVSFMPMFLGATLLEAVFVYAILRASINEVGQYHDLFSNFEFEAVCPLLFLWVTTRYSIRNSKNPMYKHLCYLMLVIWFFVIFGENIHYLLPSLALCGAAAWLAFKANSRRWFNVSVLAAVIRILIYYADVSDLMHAGIYLTGSGILIIFVILMLMKFGHLLWEKKDEK